MSFADALFMATSAVCVTGLTVHDVATSYTGFGQAAILALIQAGGLGIMVLSTFFVILSAGGCGSARRPSWPRPSMSRASRA